VVEMSTEDCCKNCELTPEQCPDRCEGVLVTAKPGELEICGHCTPCPCPMDRIDKGEDSWRLRVMAGEGPHIQQIDTGSLSEDGSFYCPVCGSKIEPPFKKLDGRYEKIEYVCDGKKVKIEVSDYE
jgi:hypothetical protein